METYAFLDYMLEDTLKANVSKAKTYVSNLIGGSSGDCLSGGRRQCCSKECLFLLKFRFCVRRSAERPISTTIDGSLIYRTPCRGTPVAMPLLAEPFQLIRISNNMKVPVRSFGRGFYHGNN